MIWGAQPLTPARRALVEQALDYIHGYQQGLPPGLLDRLRQMLDEGAIGTRHMRERARFLGLPLLGARIELDPGSLGFEVIYDWRRALRACPADDQARRDQVMAKAQQSWLFVAAALVHEGTHALMGLTASRKSDERLAYQAECRFLANVLASDPAPLVQNAARSLLADARRDALGQEGISL